MKRNQQKLHLNRETVRSLEQADLEAAVGAATGVCSAAATSCNTLCHTRGTCTSIC